MAKFAIAALFSLTIVTILHYVSTSDIPTTNVSANYCTSNETSCVHGCCPFPDAACCADGLTCCKGGQACLPGGTCLYLSSTEGEQSLASTMSTPVRSTFLSCPYGATECGKDRCCSLPNATCCSDGEHCCPQYYSCDRDGKTCTLYPTNMLSSVTTGEMSVPASRTVRKSFYKSCPGSDHVCPNDMSCCLNDTWEWSCCPKPTSTQVQHGQSRLCCYTGFFYRCCSGNRPRCVVGGCVSE